MTTIIEKLSCFKEMRNLSECQTRAQIGAVKELVTVASEKLKTNMKARFGYDDARYDNFDAYFYVPQIDGVMSITSVRSPDAEENSGLFIYIDYKGKEGNIKRLVGWQTAKVPQMVDKSEAEWLSKYTPEQIIQVAKLIGTANPITPETYRAYMEEAKIPEGIVL